MAKKKPRLQPRKAPDYGSLAGDDDDSPPTSSKKNWDDDDPGDYFGDTDTPEEKPKKKKKDKGGNEKRASTGIVVPPRQRVVSLDQDRKLTKAGVASLAVWKGKHRAKAVDKFFRGQAATGRKKYGHSAVLIGDESDALVVCIPMFGGHGENAVEFPGCLPFEFVICQDGFPLGLIMQLVAKTGVGKSGLLAEFERWFYLAGGGANTCEAETKFNLKWYESIMGTEFVKMMPLYRCSSVEDWQRKLTFGIETTQSDMIGTKERPGPGRTLPVLFGVDSVMGKQSEETQEQILGTRNVKRDTSKKGKKGGTSKVGVGHGTRGHPIEAMVITRYMRTVPNMLDGWPFSIVLVNHLRLSNDDQGNPVRSKAGGDQVGFQESFELEMKKIGGHKKMIQTKAFEGFPFEITCEKNSFGPTHRRCQLRFLWWYQEAPEDPSGWKQVTVIDWDWGTVHLLNSLMNGEKASPLIKQNLLDMDFHLKITSSGDSDNAAWSKTLGMTEDDAMSWSELGALIREDTVLMNRLRKALYINRRPLLQGDYLEQLDVMKTKLP